MWAVVSADGRATPVSGTERGAKNYATRHGYARICRVSPYSMSCYGSQVKTGGRWRPGDYKVLREEV